ncbi:ESCRT-III subunit protein did4 [Orbilia oligospora]|nr:ESCRT-III subunit protein did4 [Orbilia oligospora]
MRTELQAISLRIQTVRSNQQMMESMKGATGLLRTMNATTNLPALQKIMMDFQKESDMMEFREEVMSEAIDDVNGLEDEEETDEVLNQVLDEIGVDREMALGTTPLGLGEPEGQKEDRVAQAIGGGDDDLQARFNNLGR